MNNMENIPVEQLWYTWSDVGLSSIHAGFRIRAASPGLTEIYSERVKSMDRYMRYALPPDTNRATITPETAPISLAFIRTDWNNEYILVHKNYSGKDGVGRPGNFFVHVLALGENSSSFSVEDAIWLWDAEFWRTNDQGQDRRSNTLETLPFAVLDSNPRFHPQFAQIQRAMPFLIEAYLTRKGRTPLYIAAPAHQASMIAYLIAGLVNCLPGQLLADLTFSIYEPDITRATTEIVGTSWIATPGKENDASQVLPPQWYRDHLAINCATGEHSSFQNHPQTVYNPLAAHFAAYATECLVTENTKQLDDLCELAEKSQTLNVDLFLQLYNDEIANADSLKEAEIERYLNDSNLCLDRLSSQTFRKKIIDRVLENTQWGETWLAPILRQLRKQAEGDYVRVINQPRGAYASPIEQEYARSASSQSFQKRKNRTKASSRVKKPQLTLADVLALLAKRAIQEIVAAMKEAAKASSADSMERQQIIALMKLMDSCLLAQDPNEIWKTLFTEILASRSATEYLKSQWAWDIRTWLLQIWNKALPISADIDNTIRPLVIVPWSRLGKFLKASLRERHRQWNVFALEKLLPDTSPPPQVCKELEQSYAQEINDVLAFLLQEGSLTLASGLITRLVENSYRVKALMDMLIEQLLTALQSGPRVSLQAARDLVATLTRAGYLGTPSYQNLVETLLSTLFTIDQRAGYELLDLLVIQKYPRKKALVDIVLHSSRGYVSQESITNIIARVYQSPGEQNAFFLHDGAHYLASREQILAMISLYQILLQHFPQSKKLERLFVLLDAHLDERLTLQLLNDTPFEGHEYARVLERYGQRYLEESSEPANKVVEWFTLLAQSGYPEIAPLLFSLWTSANHQHLEKLLAVARLSLADSRRFFKTYGRQEEDVDFFQQSSTAHALFSQLALMANTSTESAQGEQLSTEKMELLFAWLEPSSSPLKYRDIETILQAAALTPAEQILFLEHYWETYLTLSLQLPSLMTYINTYIEVFNTDMLDRRETQNILLALTQNAHRLRLDENTRNRIQYWQEIESYCISPTTRVEALRNLTRALYSLGLPNNTQFTEKLARAFVSCITSPKDLSSIIDLMQNTKVKDNTLQFLYTIAEQAAARYQQLRDGKVLLPYLVFVLTWNGQGVTKHFRQVFLDTLLCHVKVVNVSAWKILNDQLTLQSLPHDAMKRWEFYLEKLDLWSRLNAAEEITIGAPEPEAGSWLERVRRKRKPEKQAAPVNNIQPASPDSPRLSSPPAKQAPSPQTRTQQQPDMHAKSFRIWPHREQKPLELGSRSAVDPSAEQQKQASQDLTKFRYEEDSKDRRKT